MFIKGKAVEDGQEFVYLGSKISQTGGTDEDISGKLGKPEKSLLSFAWY